MDSMGTNGMAGGQSQQGLTPAGLDLSTDTDAMTFLGEILDDSEFQPVDVSIARAFWYGIVIVIAIAATLNLFNVLKMRSR